MKLVNVKYWTGCHQHLLSVTSQTDKKYFYIRKVKYFSDLKHCIQSWLELQLKYIFLFLS